MKRVQFAINYPVNKPCACLNLRSASVIKDEEIVEGIIIDPQG